MTTWKKCDCRTDIDQECYSDCYDEPSRVGGSSLHAFPPTWEDCVFCKMSFPDTEVLNIEPLNPVTKGHRIFIPKEHVTDFAENADVTIKTMYSVQQYAKEIGGDFNIITSKGKCATQSVFHLHVHFVPRRENDGLPLPWTGQRDIEATLSQAHEEWKQEMRGKLPKGYDTEGTLLDVYREQYEDGYNSCLEEVKRLLK